MFLLSFLVLGCTPAGPADSGGSACDGLSADAPPITVEVVDPAGDPVAADRVRWLDPAAPVLWESAPTASCAEGTAPPCSRWTLPDALPPVVLVAADRRNEAADPPDRPTCMGFGAIAAMLLVDPDRPQLVHLTLPSEALWCDDGTTLFAEGIDRFEVLDEGDCLLARSIGETSLRVQIQDADGRPEPADWVQWYHPPKSPEYDGGHPLSCASVGCSEWRADGHPSSGDFYVEALSHGPPPPDYLQGAAWIGYGAGPQQGSPEQSITLTMEWSLGVKDAG